MGDEFKKQRHLDLWPPRGQFLDSRPGQVHWKTRRSAPKKSPNVPQRAQAVNSKKKCLFALLLEEGKNFVIVEKMVVIISTFEEVG